MMSKIRLSLLIVVSLFELISHSVSILGAQDNESADVLAGRAKEIFRLRCFECHGGSETNAGVKILDRSRLIEVDVLTPGDAEQSKLFRVITANDESVMPPDGLPTLSAEEIDTIRSWIQAGGPAFPEDVNRPEESNPDPALAGVAGADYVLKQIAAYIQSLPDEDRPFFRFFTINHLLNGGATREELNRHRQALAKAINHLSHAPAIVVPDVVDEPVGTLFALDLRKVGWHKQPFRRIDAGAQDNSSPRTLFDLVLLEYPYATIYPDSDSFDQLVDRFLVPAQMVRPIVAVRADWFVSVATQPPLYEDLLQLPRELDELEQQLGIDSQADIEDGIAQRAGMAVSGVSRNNRVVERHLARDGAYWKSFDFGSSKGRENMFADPIQLNASGGEIIFTLPNGLQAYFLANSVGRSITEAPTSIVTDKFSEDKTVRNGLACIRCHDRGMKRFSDDIRPAFERLPNSTAYSRRDVLRLYPPQEEMDRLLDADTDRFLAALELAIGDPKAEEPLIPVTRRFLDAPLSLAKVTAELGLADATAIEALFRTPQLATLGLISLASQGVVRRDMWEDCYDDVVTQLGLGVPVLAVDALTTADYTPPNNDLRVKLSTDHPNNVFAPGDEFVVLVTNESPEDVFVELVGTSARGLKVILVEATTRVKAGDTFRFPEQGTLQVRGSVGIEPITLFASDRSFPAGELLRGEHIADRIVHDLYPTVAGQGIDLSHFDPHRLLKRTISIETR